MNPKGCRALAKAVSDTNVLRISGCHLYWVLVNTLVNTKYLTKNIVTESVLQYAAYKSLCQGSAS